jgi:hypothetical protein
VPRKDFQAVATALHLQTSPKIRELSVLAGGFLTEFPHLRTAGRKMGVVIEDFEAHELFCRCAKNSLSGRVASFPTVAGGQRFR